MFYSCPASSAPEFFNALVSLAPSSADACNGSLTLQLGQLCTLVSLAQVPPPPPPFSLFPFGLLALTLKACTGDLLPLYVNAMHIHPDVIDLHGARPRAHSGNIATSSTTESFACCRRSNWHLPVAIWRLPFANPKACCIKPLDGSRMPLAAAHLFPRLEDSATCNKFK